MNTKRILALGLSVVMAATMFAGCGNQKDSGKTNDKAASKDKAAAGDTIKVGVLAPLTGSVAQYGNAVANGIRLYTKELNAAGGINGKQVELVEYDEEGDAAKAVTGYNHLADEGVVAILGDVTTGPTIAVAAESQSDRLPMITASATAPAVTYNAETDTVYDNVFRSCFIDPFQGEKMAMFANEKLEAKTAAVIMNTGSDYSMGCAKTFKEKCKELGVKVVATESYAAGAVDFQSQLTNIASKNPDVLFIPDLYDNIAMITLQARDAGVKSKLVGSDGWDSVLTTVTDPSLLEGAYYCSGYSAQDTSEAVQTFLKSYQAEYKAEPNMFSAQAYDAAMILFSALQKADADGKLDNETVISYMKETDMDCVTGHVTFDKYNNPQKSAVIINITNGEAKFWGNY